MVALIALANDQAGTVPEWICLLPHGLVRTLKGDFLADELARQEIIRNWQARGLDVVFDYEHATLSKEGTPAPASGWIVELADRGEEGLWGRVQWTERARQHLANREYRYHSPVVLVRKSDNRAVYLHSVALTNTPAIDGLEPLVASLSNVDLLQISLKEGSNVDEWLNRLIYVLQLPADSTWDDVFRVIQNLRKRSEEAEASAETATSANKAILAALDLPETATPEQARGKILALKNPAGYVPMEEHLRVTGELKALKEQIARQSAEDLVEKALSAGKITPAQKDWAMTYALKDPAGFGQFIELAAPVVPLNEVAGGKGPANQTPTVDDTQLYVNSLLGVSAEDFEKYGGAK